MGLKRNIFSGSVLAVGNTAIIIVSYPIYLKYLGTELYGLWATLSVVVSFAAIGSLGIDTAMIKYIAEEYGRNDRLAIKRYFSTAIAVLFVGGVLISLILVSLRGLLINALSIPEGYILLANKLFPCMIALSIFIFLVKAVDGTLRGLGRVDLANYYNLGVRIISIIIAIALLSSGYGIWSLFWGQISLYILLVLLTLYTIYRKLGASFFSVGSFSLKYLRKMIGFGGTMTAARLISMFLTPFNKAVIARYIGLSYVTYFEIANRAAAQLRGVFAMGLRAIMPEISRLSVLEDAQARVDSVLKQAIRLVVCFGIPSFAIFFLLGTPLLKVWISDQYVPYIGNAFRIVLVGYLINLLSIPSYYLFMGIGKVRYCFINHIVQAILNFVILLGLILLGIANFYFIIGTYSLSIALSALLLIALFAMWRKTQFQGDL